MTFPSPCPASDQLRALLDGVLGDREQAELERHLDECQACPRALEQLAAGAASFADTARRLAEAVRPGASAEGSIWRRLAAQMGGRDEDPTGEIPGDLDALAERDDWLGLLGPAPRPGVRGTLAQYEVLDRIGQGGMGMVLKALDPALSRLVA